MIRILNAEPRGFSPEARAVLSELGEVRELPLDRDQLIAHLPGVDVLVVRLAHQIDRELLQAGPNLQAIVSPTTGLDHIDTKLAAELGIAVVSLRGDIPFLRTIPATAELTWALMLALIRHLPAATDSVRRGTWDRDMFRGGELAGRRLGIAGLGRVGRQVSRFGNAFGMSVVAFDPFVTDWPDDVERLSSKEALFRSGDIVTLHLPLTPDTVDFVDTAALAWMSPDAFLINTSRGDLVDEAALVRALQDRAIAGAALDVLRNERTRDPGRSRELLEYASTHDNLLITPHIGGATVESMGRAELHTAQKLAALLRGSGTSVAPHGSPARQ